MWRSQHNNLFPPFPRLFLRQRGRLVLHGNQTDQSWGRCLVAGQMSCYFYSRVVECSTEYWRTVYYILSYNHNIIGLAGRYKTEWETLNMGDLHCTWRYSNGERCHPLPSPPVLHCTPCDSYSYFLRGKREKMNEWMMSKREKRKIKEDTMKRK